MRPAAPTLRLTGPKPWSVSRAGQETAVRATFTDPGSNDTHTCHIGWDGDGTAATFRAADHSCDRNHAFSDPGMYDTGVGVTDDDGGRDAAQVMLIVYDPTAGLPSARQAPSPRHAAPWQAARVQAARVQAARVQGARVQAAGFRQPGRRDRLLRRTGQVPHHRLHLAHGNALVRPPGHRSAPGSRRVDGKDGYDFLAYVQPGRFRAAVWPLSQGGIPPAAPLCDNHRGAGHDVDQVRAVAR